VEKINNQNNIVLAKPEHLIQIVRIIRETATWLKTKGINQWSENYPISRLEKEILNGELFVVLDKSKDVIGTLSLSKNKGDLWIEDNASAIYLNRLAIFRKYAGQELGSKIIHWAVDHCKQLNIKFLRLSCDKTNPFLSDFYKDYGFKLIGEFYYSPWKMTFNLFEMTV
jgi:predicted GNAT family N-acyltransferase